MADVDTTAETDIGATLEAGTPAATDTIAQTPGTLLTDKPGEGANGQQDAGKPDGADGKGEAGKEGADAPICTKPWGWGRRPWPSCAGVTCKLWLDGHWCRVGAFGLHQGAHDDPRPAQPPHYRPMAAPAS